MPVNTLGSGQVIDLRGSPTGLEGLAQVLGAVLGKVMESEEDKVRKELEANPELGPLFAAEGHRIAAEMSKMADVGKAPSLEELEAGKGFTGGKDATGEVDPQKAIIPTLPSGTKLTPGILQELMATYPEPRGVKVERALEGSYTPEAEAADITDEQATLRTERGARDTTANLAVARGEREQAVMEAASAAGFSPRMEGNLRALNAQIEGMDMELTEQGFSRYAAMVEDAPEDMQDILTLSMNPDRGSIAAQFLMNKESMNRADARARLASMETPKDRLDFLTARYALKTSIREDVEKTISDWNAIEDRGLKEQMADGVIANVNDLAREMLIIDPSSLVQMASAERGLFGGVKGINLRLSDIVESKADAVEVAARQYFDMGGERRPENLQMLIEGSKDLAGLPNQRLVDAIRMRAMEIESGFRTQDTLMEEARQELLSYGGNVPSASEVAEKIANMNRRLEAAYREGTTNEMLNINWELRKQGVLQYLIESKGS